MATGKQYINRPLHGFFYCHLGCGTIAAKITENVCKILQLSTLRNYTSDFDEKCVSKKVMT